MNEKIVTIYTTSDEIEANRVSQLLAQHGIDSHIHNARPQDLFGMGRLGSGYNLAVGLLEVQIHEKQQEKALTILKDEMELDEAMDSVSEHPETGAKQQDTEESKTITHKDETKKRQSGYAIRSVILSLMWLFGVGSLFGIYFGIRGIKYRPVLSAFGIAFGIAGLPLLVWFILRMI
jgi:hypothetical protein